MDHSAAPSVKDFQVEGDVKGLGGLWRADAGLSRHILTQVGQRAASLCSALVQQTTTNSRRAFHKDTELLVEQPHPSVRYRLGFDDPHVLVGWKGDRNIIFVSITKCCVSSFSHLAGNDVAPCWK